MKAALAACGPGEYPVVDESECLAAAACQARGWEARAAGFCREVFRISTEDELLRMDEHPYAAYLLTADITLSSPAKPIPFPGELDGQGHWIRGIAFDFRTLCEQGGVEGTLDGGLFPDIAVVQSVGLDVSGNFSNDVFGLTGAYIGALAGLAENLVLVRDAVVSGTLGLQSGTSRIDWACVGGVIARSNLPGAVIGPNVTSYCNLSCSAFESCRVGGVAARFAGTLDGAAVLRASLSASAGLVELGGLVGVLDLQRGPLQRSFAELGSVSLAGGYSGIAAGGLVGRCEGQGTIRDCYAMSASIAIRPGPEARAAVSPFVGEGSSESLALERCYAWLQGEVSSAVTQAELAIGGLVACGAGGGWPSPPALSSSMTPRSLRPGRLASGMLGRTASFGSDSGAAVSLQASWVDVQVSAFSAEDAQLGGLIGGCAAASDHLTAKDVSVSIVPSGEVLPRAAETAVGAIAAELRSGEVSSAIVLYSCVGGPCGSLPLLAEGSATVSGLYAVQFSGTVTLGAASGEINVADGKYVAEDYPGLSGELWDFHGSAGIYPTLASLPRGNVDGRGNFAKPERSSWSSGTWAVPTAQVNPPQLVENPRCKQVGGNAVCADCPMGPCLACDGSAELLDGGRLCLLCDADFTPSVEFRACVSRKCTRGCQVCGEGGKCLECSGGAAPSEDGSCPASGPTAGAIAGIVVAVAVVVVALALCLYFLVCRKRSRSASSRAGQAGPLRSLASPES